MKMTIASFVSLALISFFSFAMSAQSLKTPAPSPFQTIKQSFALSEITIEYSRPSVKGRVIFGDLVPFGKIWRTGANAATQITFGEETMVQGHVVAPGTYALYTIPNKNNWEIIFYKDLKLGGNTSEFNKDDEAFRFSVKPTALSTPVETFTIGIADMTASTAMIELAWEKTKITFDIKVDIDTKVMKNIENVMSKDGRPYYQAASYFYENDKDINQALTWINVATEQSPNAYWVHLLKAKIQLKLKDKAGAIATAQKVIEMAKAGGSDEYVKLANKLIADAK